MTMTRTPNNTKEQIKNDINELLQLKDGWDEPSDRKVSKKMASKMIDCLERNIPKGMPAPFVGPMTDGGITLDWDTPDGQAVVSLLFRNYIKDFEKVRLVLIGVIKEPKNNYIDLYSESDWKYLKDMALNGICEKHLLSV